MKYGIDNEENVVISYVDIICFNVYLCGIIVNFLCFYLVCFFDCRVYDLSEVNLWGILEIKCFLVDFVVELLYLKEVNGVLKLKKIYSYYY